MLRHAAAQPIEGGTRLFHWGRRFSPLYGTPRTLACAAPTHVQTPLLRPARAAAFYLAIHRSGAEKQAPSSALAMIAVSRIACVLHLPRAFGDQC